MDWRCRHGMCGPCPAHYIEFKEHLRDAWAALGHVALRLLGALPVAARQLRSTGGQHEITAPWGVR